MSKLLPTSLKLKTGPSAPLPPLLPEDSASSPTYRFSSEISRLVCPPSPPAGQLDLLARPPV